MNEQKFVLVPKNVIEEYLAVLKGDKKLITLEIFARRNFCELILENELLLEDFEPKNIGNELNNIITSIVMSDGEKHQLEKSVDQLEKLVQRLWNYVPPEPNRSDAAIEAIKYALDLDETRDTHQFLHDWLNGEFDVLHEDYPDVPDTVFIGADPLFKPNSAAELDFDKEN